MIDSSNERRGSSVVEQLIRKRGRQRCRPRNVSGHFASNLLLSLALAHTSLQDSHDSRCGEGLQGPTFWAHAQHIESCHHRPFLRGLVTAAASILRAASGLLVAPERQRRAFPKWGKEAGSREGFPMGSPGGRTTSLGRDAAGCSSQKLMAPKSWCTLGATDCAARPGTGCPGARNRRLSKNGTR